MNIVWQCHCAMLSAPQQRKAMVRCSAKDTIYLMVSDVAWREKYMWPEGAWVWENQSQASCVRRQEEE